MTPRDTKTQNPPDRWSGEARRERVEALPPEDELKRRVFVVGRLVKTDEGWFLERVER